MTLALASAALADDVTNRIDTTVDATLENITLNEGASQSVNLRVVPVGGDGETGGGCNVDAGEQLVVALSSSNTSVATLSPQALTFTGCNLDQGTTVTAGARGTETVTAAEQSNTTGTGTYNYAPASFSVTVNNVAPTVSNIADQTTNEDTSTGNIAFTVGDAGTPAGNLTVTGSSSNTTLVPNANITFGGSGANRTVQIAPAANQSGTATITVNVSDGAATTSDTFVLTVNAVNDTPTISNIQDAATDEDTATSDIPFTVGDVETAAGSLTVSGSSSNTTLVPNANITFGGSGASRTVKVTPAANRSGTATITVSVSDGSANTSDTFVLTVNAVNDAPAISSVTNNGPVGEGSPATVTVAASDADGDTLSYEFDCNNDGIFEVGPQGANNAQCSFNDEGTYRVNVRIGDGNGGAATGFTDVTVNAVDSVAPWVATALPVGKKVSPKAKVTARFSEEIDVSTLDSTTFVLTRKGVQVPATITYDAATDTAFLTPTTKLKKKATYVATVTTGVEDMAGNALDQDRNPGNGNQPMVWSFKVKG